MQLEQLRAAGCSSRNIYREKVTGARADRRELLRMLDRLAPGDVVTVTRIDRLARSTFDLFGIVKRIVDAKAQFRSLVPRSTVDWDTSQADDFRTRGEPWIIKRTRLEAVGTRRSERPGVARWRSGVEAGCHASARVRQCSGCCAGKTWKPSRASWASRQQR